MKTDIQIAQKATMLPVKDVAAAYGISEDNLELYRIFLLILYRKKHVK